MFPSCKSNAPFSFFPRFFFTQRCIFLALFLPSHPNFLMAAIAWIGSCIGKEAVVAEGRRKVEAS